MSLELINLNENKVREFMYEEFELDFKEQRVYISPRIKSALINEYITLLKEAIQNGTAATLANSISNYHLLKSMETRSQKGKIIQARVPVNAHETLAEGEFNRFYIRGVCRVAISEKLEIEIYRAKKVRNPRRQSQILIGMTIDPNKLLKDLRMNIGVDTALGVPAGPNSGLSIQLRR